MVSALLINDVPVECINAAAVKYYVPAAVIISVLQVENGRVGMKKRNPNGSYDFGPMQINSLWLRDLSRYGIALDDLVYDPCVNVDVGTWILSQKIADANVLWKGVADYHSKTPNEHFRYRRRVTETYTELMHALGSDPHG